MFYFVPVALGWSPMSKRTLYPNSLHIKKSPERAIYINIGWSPMSKRTLYPQPWKGVIYVLPNDFIMVIYTLCCVFISPFQGFVKTCIILRWAKYPSLTYIALSGLYLLPCLESLILKSPIFQIDYHYYQHLNKGFSLIIPLNLPILK